MNSELSYDMHVVGITYHNHHIWTLWTLLCLYNMLIMVFGVLIVLKMVCLGV